MAWAAGRLGVGLDLGAGGRSLEGETLPVTAAERLSARLEELGSALERAGAPAGATAHLLELSALATLKAVELDLRTSTLDAAAATVPRNPLRPPPDGLVPVEPAA
jgi:hypothetical protein